MTHPIKFRNHNWRGAYDKQKRHAKERSINFYFNYPQWVNWWEANLGPHWFTFRGRQKGQYCMCRKGDKGPYATWNVECKTVAENKKDACTNGAIARGEKVASAKFNTRQIRLIRISSKTQIALAAFYKVDRQTIGRIQKRQTWKHVLP